MSYKRLIPSMFLYRGKAIKWFNDTEIVSENPIELAKYYSDNGADELIVFDLSNTDQEQEESLDILKKINCAIRIPMTVGGNIKRQEDVKKILYTGAKRAIINLSKPDMLSMIEEVSKRFGKDKIAVSLNDFDALFKQQNLIEKYSSAMIFMHRLDLASVMNITDILCVVVTDTMEESELYKILASPGVKGLSGKYINDVETSFEKFKAKCTEQGIKMTSFECTLDFSEFRVNQDGLVPVVVQDYKTGEVLMMDYMDEESFDYTIKTGRMKYYKGSIHKQVKDNYQYVKSIMIDCDKVTLLAKVDQVGTVCQLGHRTCFHNLIAGTEYKEQNPLQVVEKIYETIQDKKKNPVEGSYTTYLFDRGIDTILKKIGEEATEIVIAAKNPNPEELKYEITDFLYHAMVLMAEKDVNWKDIIKELSER